MGQSQRHGKALKEMEEQGCLLLKLLPEKVGCAEGSTLEMGDIGRVIQEEGEHRSLEPDQS